MGNGNIRLVNTNPDLFPLLNMTMMLQVLSVTLDEWSDDEIDAMVEVGGNASANSIYEAYIPEGISKPGPDASHEQRSKFIRLGQTWKSCFFYLSLRLEAYCISRYQPSRAFPYRLLCQFSGKILVRGVGDGMRMCLPK